jgi:hydrophobic/amphiphilic exporter-1 (mainly G- bacteria), HAE1 family
VRTGVKYAGQYESWYAPLSVIFSVPLALAGPVLVLGILRIDNNLYTQIGIILLIALSAKTSFSFILGVLPLVIASGAGASARKSIGITVFSGMLASTCLAVLFVPSMFCVVQRFEEWRAAGKHRRLKLAE